MLFDPARRLKRRRILVAEDEIVTAMAIEFELREQEAIVVGPAVSLSEARVLAEEPLDAAILDINLQGESVFPAAAVLARRGVPIVFFTGYDDHPALAEFRNACDIRK